MLQNGFLSDTARKAIAGYLYLSRSLTAFGNMIPTSYFRLVPNQEAPTTVCWGDRNRSVLVRVPLGWNDSRNNMVKDANPGEKETRNHFINRQTVEFRSPDGSADVYLLFAGLAVAVRHGLEMKEALAFARKTYVDVNIFNAKNKKQVTELQHLPSSCWDSADALESQRAIYQSKGVFPENILDGVIKKLRSFDDNHLLEKIRDSEKEILKLVNSFLHCG